jgi:hypothetical protein
MSSSAAFSKALDKKKSALKMLDKASKAELGGDFSVPNIPADEYLARVKAKCDVTPKKGVPFVEFKWTIVDGEYKGKGYRETMFLGESDNPERDEKTWTRLGKTLKVLSTRDVVTFEDFDELAEVVNEIDEATPLCHIKTTRWQNAKDKEHEVKTGEYKESGLGCFFNKRVEDKAEPQDSSQDEPGYTDKPSTDGFGKDDAVIYEGEEYVVVTSSVRNETCTIKSFEDPNIRHKDVPWGELELLQ